MNSCRHILKGCLTIIVLFSMVMPVFAVSYQAYRTLGEEQIKDETYEDALKSLQKAYRINPKDVRTIDLIGIAYMESGSLQRAMIRFKKTVMLEPGYFIGFYHMGKLYEKMKNAKEKAVHMYKKAISLNQDFAPAHESLGEIYFEDGSFKKAKIHFEILSKMYPDNTYYMGKLVKCFVNGKNHEKAISVLQILLLKKPAEAKLLNLLAYSLAKQGHLERARKHLRKALELSPTFVEAMCNLGEVESMDGNLENAINYYENATRIKPGFVRAYYLLGKAYSVMDIMESGGAKSKYLQKSIDTLDEGLSVALTVGDKESISGIYYQNGLNYLREKEYLSASEMFYEAVKRKKKNINFALGLARSYIFMGKTEKAEPILEGLERKVENNFKVLLVYGEFYMQEEKYSKARRYFKKALRVNSRSRKVRKNLRKIEQMEY